MLVLRSAFPPFHTLPGEHYPTVNAKWYAEVGAPLIQTMVIQFVTPPGVHIFMAVLNRCLAGRCVFSYLRYPSHTHLYMLIATVVFSGAR